MYYLCWRNEGIKDFRNQKTVWKTSDAKIAAVNKNGNVKAKKNGTVTITAILVTGSKGKKYTCKVKVVDKLNVFDQKVMCYLDEYEEINAWVSKEKEKECVSLELKSNDIIDCDFSGEYTKKAVLLLE